jgi:hypothetical protein
LKIIEDCLNNVMQNQIRITLAMPIAPGEQIPAKKCNEIENGRESETKNVSIVVHAKPNDPCCVMGE